MMESFAEEDFPSAMATADDPPLVLERASPLKAAAGPAAALAAAGPELYSPATPSVLPGGGQTPEYERWLASFSPGGAGPGAETPRAAPLPAGARVQVLPDAQAKLACEAAGLVSSRRPPTQVAVVAQTGHPVALRRNGTQHGSGGAASAVRPAPAALPAPRGRQCADDGQQTQGRWCPWTGRRPRSDLRMLSLTESMWPHLLWRCAAWRRLPAPTRPQTPASNAACPPCQLIARRPRGQQNLQHWPRRRRCSRSCGSNFLARSGCDLLAALRLPVLLCCSFSR